MNALQHIDESKHGKCLVSINPHIEPDPSTVQGRWTFDHPVIDAAALRTQAELPSIQNKRGISYAGAWIGYGFHEDGFTAGLRAAAEHIPGVCPPFSIVDVQSRPRPAEWLAAVFDILERSGVREMVGLMLSMILLCLRQIVGRVVNLKHIEAGKVKRI